MAVEITRTPHAYVAHLDGVRVGELRYRSDTDRVTALHTEVDPAAEGKGVGSALARALLGDARDNGVGVVATCPFVASYLDRHPEYADLRVD